MSFLSNRPSASSLRPQPQPEQRRPRLRVLLWASTALFAMALTQLMWGKILSLHAVLILGTLAGNVGVGLLAKNVDRIHVPTVRPTAALVLLGVVGGASLGLAGAGLTGLIADVFTQWIAETPYQSAWDTLIADRESMFERVLLLDRKALIPIVFLAIAVTPGLSEEFFFRGVLQSLAAPLPMLRRCLFIGVVFGVIHFDVVGLVPLILLGTLFALVREWTGSWVVPAVMHITFNALNALVLARFEGLDAQVLPLFIVGTLASTVLLFVLHRAATAAART